MVIVGDDVTRSPILEPGCANEPLGVEVKEAETSGITRGFALSVTVAFWSALKGVIDEVREDTDVAGIDGLSWRDLLFVVCAAAAFLSSSWAFLWLVGVWFCGVRFGGLDFVC